MANNGNETPKPDMRSKVEEYILTLDSEIERLLEIVGKSGDSQGITGKIKAYDNVRNDLRRMLDELI